MDWHRCVLHVNFCLLIPEGTHINGVTAALSLTQAFLIYGSPPSDYFNQIRAQVKDSFYIDINAAHFSKKHVYWRVWVNTKLRLLAFFF